MRVCVRMCLGNVCVRACVPVRVYSHTHPHAHTHTHAHTRRSTHIEQTQELTRAHTHSSTHTHIEGSNLKGGGAYQQRWEALPSTYVGFLIITHRDTHMHGKFAIYFRISITGARIILPLNITPQPQHNNSTHPIAFKRTVVSLVPNRNPT